MLVIIWIIALSTTLDVMFLMMIVGASGCMEGGREGGTVSAFHAWMVIGLRRDTGRLSMS